MVETFKNRTEAGKLLAAKLTSYKNCKDVIVLALPRGGVPVGYQVASFLQVPLDILLVRKLGAPDQEELAMGAIASGGITIFNDDLIRMLDVPVDTIEVVMERELQVLEHREKLYRGDRPPPDVKKTVILVDDGIATGATTRVAIKALKKLGCKKIVVATPVIPPDTFKQLQKEGDEIICLAMPTSFYAIGVWYQDFSQTSDEEVIELLAKAENFGPG